MEEIKNTKRYAMENGQDYLANFELAHSQEEVRGAYKFTIGRYLERYMLKNGIHDLSKAQEYISRLISYEKRQNLFNEQLEDDDKENEADEYYVYDSNGEYREEDRKETGSTLFDFLNYLSKVSDNFSKIGDDE